MLPCGKRFHNFPCPFNESGLCDRPYCHYSHTVRPSPSRNVSPSVAAPLPCPPAPASSASSSTPSSSLADDSVASKVVEISTKISAAMRELQELMNNNVDNKNSLILNEKLNEISNLNGLLNLEQNETKTVSSSSSSSSSATAVATVTAGKKKSAATAAATIVYKPTKKKASVKSSFPEYKPTPLSQLRKMAPPPVERYSFRSDDDDDRNGNDDDDDDDDNSSDDDVSDDDDDEDDSSEDDDDDAYHHHRNQQQQRRHPPVSDYSYMPARMSSPFDCPSPEKRQKRSDSSSSFTSRSEKPFGEIIPVHEILAIPPSSPSPVKDKRTPKSDSKQPPSSSAASSNGGSDSKQQQQQRRSAVPLSPKKAPKMAKDDDQFALSLFGDDVSPTREDARVQKAKKKAQQAESGPRGPMGDGRKGDEEGSTSACQEKNATMRQCDDADTPPVPKKPKIALKKEATGDDAAGKRRVAHVATHDVGQLRQKVGRPKSSFSSYAEQMQERLDKIREQSQVTAKTPNESRSASSSPAASGLAASTVAQTTSKDQRRVAHIPSVAAIRKPVLPMQFNSKVPTVIRQRYLNMIFDELVKITSSQEEAYDQSLSEEKSLYGRSGTKSVCTNLAVQLIHNLRTRSASLAHRKPSQPSKSSTSPSASSSAPSASPATPQKLSHEALLSGPRALRTSYSIERPKKLLPSTLSEERLYELLLPYVLSEEQLVENGFPRPCVDLPGMVIIRKTNFAPQTEKRSNPDEKTCSRCSKVFMVTEDGVYKTQEECMFHWGRMRNMRLAARTFEQRYFCCQGTMSSPGCQSSRLHVYDQDLTVPLEGFVKTQSSAGDKKDSKCRGVFALDCEMCYTMKGLELARITVVNSSFETVYDALVKPDFPIIDYNSRWSGLTEEDFVDVDMTIRDVQKTLLQKFNGESILIGHSLESDLKALKMVHDRIVDTSVVFPHSMGRPFKRALRTLTSEYLQRIIQEDAAGHDSREDAVSCMQLMFYKVKEDLKKMARKV